MYSGNMNDRVDWGLLLRVAALPGQPRIHLVGTAARTQLQTLRRVMTHDQVVYHGPRNELETLDLLSQADVAIMPHKVDEFSTFMNPLKLSMYEALGLPVVSTDVPGVTAVEGMVHVVGERKPFVRTVAALLDKAPERRARRATTSCPGAGDHEECSGVRRHDRSRRSRHLKAGTMSSYPGICSICGAKGEFQRGSHPSIRESYACPSCNYTLRWRDQATLILNQFARGAGVSLSSVVSAPVMDHVRIYEPALGGPFRKQFASLPSYASSYYWEGGSPGDVISGVHPGPQPSHLRRRVIRPCHHLGRVRACDRPLRRVRRDRARAEGRRRPHLLDPAHLAAAVQERREGAARRRRDPASRSPPGTTALATALTVW